jgi:hypothetical protein
LLGPDLRCGGARLAAITLLVLLCSMNAAKLQNVQMEGEEGKDKGQKKTFHISFTLVETTTSL